MKTCLLLLLTASRAFALTMHIDATMETGDKDIKGDPITQTAHGTCVAIDDTHIITAAHNVEKEYKKVRVEYEGKWVSCKVERRGNDKKKPEDCVDIALLKCSVKLNVQPLTIERRVLRMEGSPVGEEIVSNSGEATGESRIICDTKIGVSGGPVWNEQGELAGMVVSGQMNASADKWDQRSLRTFNFITAATIRKFLGKK